MFQGFRDRKEAGRFLAQKLKTYSAQTETMVLALPRGGVPVGFEVARSLHLPRDVLVVRKLGVPGQEELAFGAIASGGAYFLNQDIIRAFDVSPEMIETIERHELSELKRRETLYRGNRSPLDVSGKTVILVDDGLATGASMRVAISAVKKLNARKIIVAVPVGSVETCLQVSQKANVLCTCAVTPEPFYSVGIWYGDFSQTTDEEVQNLLVQAETASEEKHFVS